LRVRVSDNVILPKYLNWFIRQAPAQAFLTSHAKGTAQKMISKETLEGLEVFVPPLERQRTIVEITALAEQERQILEKLATRRHQFISIHLIRLAQGA
jgi:restriction endonuclease S subunit